MKFPDSVTKAFNKKPKKIGLQDVLPLAAIGVLCSRAILIFFCHPPPRTFIRFAI
jgi:hypothetical protein